MSLCLTLGGGGSLVNIIEVSTTSTILDSQLIQDRINVVLVMTAGITVTLPLSDASKIVMVQQGYEGSGEFTVCKTTA